MSIRGWRARVKAQNAQPARPIKDQILHPDIVHIVLRRQDKILNIAKQS
jgi:hypothetical protein